MPHIPYAALVCTVFAEHTARAIPFPHMKTHTHGVWPSHGQKEGGGGLEGAAAWLAACAWSEARSSSQGATALGKGRQHWAALHMGSRGGVVRRARAGLPVVCVASSEGGGAAGATEAGGTEAHLHLSAVLAAPLHQTYRLPTSTSPASSRRCGASGLALTDCASTSSSCSSARSSVRCL
eukprot:360147-Chlamydomonas_euryale.AAC.2